MQNPFVSVPGRTALIAALSLSAGWMLGNQHPDRPANLRAQMLAEVRHSREFQDECLEDLKNQYTPGYKAHQIFYRLDTGKVRLNMSEGTTRSTGNGNDLAISGAGFFVLQKNHQPCYTRDGRFHLFGGQLTSLDGSPVQGFALNAKGTRVGKMVDIAVPLEPRTMLYCGKYTDLVVDQEGKLMASPWGHDADPVPLFQLALAAFESPASLRESATTLAETRDSGTPAIGVPGQGILGNLCTEALEQSNVDPIEEGQAICAMKAYAGLLLDDSGRLAYPECQLPQPAAAAPLRCDLFTPADIQRFSLGTYPMAVGRDPMTLK